MLGDDDFGLALDVFVLAVVILFAMDEGYDVGVLLDGAGLAEVGEQRLLVAGALFGSAGELREGDDGDAEFFGEGFEAAGDAADFLGAVLELFLRAAGGAGHELEVVDDDEVEGAFLLAEAAGLGAHFGEGDAGGVVDEHLGVHEAVERGDELALVFAGDEAGLEFSRADHGLAG